MITEYVLLSASLLVVLHILFWSYLPPKSQFLPPKAHFTLEETHFNLELASKNKKFI